MSNDETAVVLRIVLIIVIMMSGELVGWVGTIIAVVFGAVWTLASIYLDSRKR
jgi:hypothetical protein